jgi:hypothetical protein
MGGKDLACQTIENAYICHNIYIAGSEHLVDLSYSTK